MTGLAPHFSWDKVDEDRLRGNITRRMLSGQSMMIAQVRLMAGDDVPVHSHPNEQITYIISGAIRFTLGHSQEEDVVVRAGEVLIIPPNLPHSAIALEDTLDIDIFSPPRQDWLAQTDSYLREG